MTPVGLITGGSGGIGQAIGHLLQVHGFQVILASRSQEKLSMATAGTDFMPLIMDVTDPVQVKKGFTEIMDKWGRLDLLVNAAGITKFAPLARMHVDDWDAQFAVHSRGSFLCAQQALKIMRKQKSGAIVNIASLGAKLPRVGFAAYGAAKAALVNLTLNLNQEGGAYGIRVTTICPTYVNTPMLVGADLAPQQMLSPEVVAEAILFLWRLPPNVLIQELVLETVAPPIAA